MLHRRRHVDPVAGCFGCKATTVRFGSVPDVGSAGEEVSHGRHVEANLNRFRNMVEHGVEPDGTTREALDRTEQKHALWERTERMVGDSVPSEQAAEIRKSLTNRP